MQMTKKPASPTVSELQAKISNLEVRNGEYKDKIEDSRKDYRELENLRYYVKELKEAFQEMNIDVKADGSLTKEDLSLIRKALKKAQIDAQDGTATESIKPYLEALLLQRGEALTEVSFVKVDGKWRSTLSFVEYEEVPDYASYRPKFNTHIKNRVKVHSVDAETFIGSISGLKDPPPKKSAMSRSFGYIDIK